MYHEQFASPDTASNFRSATPQFLKLISIHLLQIVHDLRKDLIMMCLAQIEAPLDQGINWITFSTIRMFQISYDQTQRYQKLLRSGAIFCVNEGFTF